MKIIDLLNKIANDKEIPKRIKHKDLIYEYQEECRDYAYIDNNNYYTWFFNDTISDITFFNDEIELIEDQTIYIDSIEEIDTTKIFNYTMEQVFEWNNEMEEKINQTIRAVKHLNKEMQSIKEK